MLDFEAVLFDWMLTLAHYPSPSKHVAVAMQLLGRPADSDAVDRIVEAIAAAKNLPEIQAAEAVEDSSVEAHHYSEHLLYERAGIEPVLADQMYRLLGDPEFHPPYPDTRSVIHELSELGLRIGVVSDIHVDLRVHAERFGFIECIDAWALSYELGVQKPDPRIFQFALEELGCAPDRALMVGDRPSHDGAAAELGMTCLILPARSECLTRGLESVVRVVAPRR